MANLRTNNLSGEQGQNAYRGSVFFDGQNTRIEITASSDLALGTDDYTIEAWVRFSKIDTYQTIIDFRGSSNGNYPFIVRDTDGDLYYYINGSRLIDNIPARENNTWHHIAVVRSSGTTNFYLNGVSEGNASDSTNYIADENVDIGATTNDNDFFGYISNLRITKEALYTSTFTPPLSELKALPNTVLLCCQDSDDPTQEETGKTLTGLNGLSDIDLVKQQPKVIPPYGVDAGNAFGGSIQQSTQGYMYFPTGRTEERGGTRACWFRGYDSPEGNKNIIDFSEMSSRGNTTHFGDALSSNRQAGALGSSTRGVFGGRDGGSNVIEFVTFSTQSNSSDFGDFTAARAAAPATASDGTRGLFFGGYVPSIAEANVIEFITIATLGNGTDFGDLTNKGSEPAGCASPTRAIRMGGRLTGNNPTDVIDFFTIQTVGNAQDFGDLTVGRSEAGGASSDTRGVCIAGYNYPGGGQNVIDFVTIASSGNATDFGDLAAYTDSWQGGSGSNNLIIAHGIGYNDSARDNRIDFITIATTGNSVDYGDLTDPRSQIPCATNGHGGLS